ncbi:hypothetical protein Tco_1346062 [Tanacetum coccineum]
MAAADGGVVAAATVAVDDGDEGDGFGGVGGVTIVLVDLWWRGGDGGRRWLAGVWPEVEPEKIEILMIIRLEEHARDQQQIFSRLQNTSHKPY